MAYDGLLVRDGCHLKVKDKLLLKPYLIWAATWETIGQKQLYYHVINECRNDSGRSCGKISLTIQKTYDRLDKNCGKVIFIMQIVDVRAYWHIVHAWLVNSFVNLAFVYPYKIMLSLKTI